MLFRAARQSHEAAIRYIKSAIRDCFAAFKAELTPAPWTETLEDVIAPDADITVQPWFPAIKTGIQVALSEVVARKARICSLRVGITWVKAHPIASSEKSFQGAGKDLVYDLAAAFITTVEPPPIAWLTNDTVGIARAIEEDKTDAHPILADALEEAGCDDSLWLDHLRQCPDHEGGCWVAQLIMQQYAQLREEHE